MPDIIHNLFSVSYEVTDIRGVIKVNATLTTRKGVFKVINGLNLLVQHLPKDIKDA